MDEGLQDEWLSKWQKVLYLKEEYSDKNEQDAQIETINFRYFLRDQECPEEVKQELAVEPLLLYLLAAMHRDGKIQLADFGIGNRIQSKITIYQQSLEWVLTKQRDKALQRQITGLSADEFHGIISVSLSFHNLPEIAESNRKLANQLHVALSDSLLAGFTRQTCQLMINPSVVEFQETLKKMTTCCRPSDTFFLCIVVRRPPEIVCIHNNVVQPRAMGCASKMERTQLRTLHSQKQGLLVSPN